jgi:hypothetical protein
LLSKNACEQDFSPAQTRESEYLLVYEDCGHVPMEEVPERSAAAVRAFMQSP